MSARVTTTWSRSTTWFRSPTAPWWKVPTRTDPPRSAVEGCPQCSRRSCGGVRCFPIIEHVFESPLVPRTAPAVAEDVPWEQFRELDPVGAAQAQAQCWAIDRGLCADPDAEGYRAPVATAAVATAVAELDGPALAGFLAGLPPAAGGGGGPVARAPVGYARAVRWARSMQLRGVAELAARRQDGRTGWARDTPNPA